MKKTGFKNEITMFPAVCRRTALSVALLMALTGLRFLFLISYPDLIGASASAVLGLASLTIFILTSKHLREKKASKHVVNGILRIGTVVLALGGLALIGFMTAVYVPWLLRGVAISDVWSHLAFILTVVGGVIMMLCAKGMRHLDFDVFVPEQEIMDPSH